LPSGKRRHSRRNSARASGSSRRRKRRSSEHSSNGVYTGTYELGGERRLATHNSALMWDAVGIPAPGTCQGPFGAWSLAPRRRA